MYSMRVHIFDQISEKKSDAKALKEEIEEVTAVHV